MSDTMSSLFSADEIQKRIFEEMQVLGDGVKGLSAVVQNRLDEATNEEIVEMRDKMSEESEAMQKKLAHLTDEAYRVMSNILHDRGHYDEKGNGS